MITTLTAQMDLSMGMEDDDILDLVPAGILRDFRDTVRIKYYNQYRSLNALQMFPNNFIRDNPQLFLGTEWVQIDQLKVYLQKQGVSRDSPVASKCRVWVFPHTWHTYIVAISTRTNARSRARRTEHNGIIHEEERLIVIVKFIARFSVRCLSHKVMTKLDDDIR
jgi:hypothetical protein